MEIVFDQTEPDRALWRSSLGIPDASWTETIKTSAVQALVRSPTLSLFRMDELNRAKGGLPVLKDIPGWLPLEPEGPTEDPDSPFLTKEEYQASPYYRKGFYFPDGVKSEVARILADRHDEEKKRQEILSRAPKGNLAKGAMFATDLIASALDPLNVASAFVPVVGEARFAIWAAKYGKTAARAMRGGIEGAAGAAMVEPIVLSAARQEQADYDMTDSLLNIGLGGVFGGGLHAGAGALKDTITRARAHTREGALKASVGQFAEGRDIDVEPLLRADDRIGDSAELGGMLQREKLPDIPLPKREVTEADFLRSASGEREVLSHIPELQDLQSKGLITQMEVDVLIAEAARGMNEVSEYRRAAQALADCLIG